MENNATPNITFFEVTPIWRGALPRNVVFQALLDAGIEEDNLPRPPNTTECLLRAMRAVAPRCALVRQFSPSKDDTYCVGGVSLATEDKDRLDLTRYGANEAHQTSLTAKAYEDPDTHEVTLRMEPAYHPMCALVEAEFRKQQEMLVMNADVSLWITSNVLPSCGAVRKRPNGGVYYVPSSKADLLLRAQKGLESVSQFTKFGRSPLTGEDLKTVARGGMIHMEPRTSSDAATLSLVLDGIVNDVDIALTDVADKLGKGLGIRALRTKKGDVEELEKKLMMYEQILGSSLPLLKQKIAETQAAVGFTLSHEEHLREQRLAASTQQSF